MSMPIDRSESNLLVSLSQVNLKQDMKEGDRLVIRNGRSFAIVKSTDTLPEDTKELYAIVNQIKNAKLEEFSGSNKQLISNLEVLNGKVLSHNKKIGHFLTFINSVWKFFRGEEIKTYKTYETLEDKVKELSNSPKTIEDCFDNPNVHHPIAHLANLYSTNQNLESNHEEAIYELMIHCPHNELKEGGLLLDKLPSEQKMRIFAGILSQMEIMPEKEQKNFLNTGLFNYYFSGTPEENFDKFWDSRLDQKAALSDTENRVFIHLLEQVDSARQKEGLSKLLIKYTEPFLEHYLNRSTKLPTNIDLVRNLLLRMDGKNIQSMPENKKGLLRGMLTPSPLLPTSSDFSTDSVKLFSLLVSPNVKLSESEENYIVKCAKEWPEHYNNQSLMLLLQNLPMNVRAEILASAKETVFNAYYTPTRSFLSDQGLNRPQANLSLTSFECTVMKRLILKEHTDVQQGAQRYLQLICSPGFQLGAEEILRLSIQLLSKTEIDPKTKQPKLDADTERLLKTQLPLLVSNSPSNLIPTCIALFEKLPVDTAMYVLSALSPEKRAGILSATKSESPLIRTYYSSTRSFFTDQKLALSSMISQDQWKILKQLLISGNLAPLAERVNKASVNEGITFFKSIREAFAQDSLSSTQVLATLLGLLATFSVESKRQILVEEAHDLLKTPESSPERKINAESLSLLSLYYPSQQTFIDELPKKEEEISTEKAKDLKDIYRALVRLDKTTFGQEAILMELGERLKMPVREVEELGNSLQIPLSFGVQIDSAIETGKEAVGEFVENTGKAVDETFEEARKKAEQTKQALAETFDEVSEEARKKAEQALIDVTESAKKTVEDLGNQFKKLFR